MNNPIYIFDIDGTLSLLDHRLHFLENKSDPDRWLKFYQECDKDLPNMPVINTMQLLAYAGAEILFFTGRTEAVRGKTIDWLMEFTGYAPNNAKLTMRPNGNYTKDSVLKQSWLDKMFLGDIDRIAAVFDDRQQVVDMWRRNNIVCFQVAEGKF